MEPKLSFIVGLSIGFLNFFIYFILLQSSNIELTPEKKRSDSSWKESFKHLRNFTKRMELIQKERQSTLRIACSRIAKESGCKNNFTRNQLRGVYSKRYKFSVCYIFKCGFTSWLQSVLVMDDLRSEQDYFAGNMAGDKIFDLAKRHILFNRKRDENTTMKKYSTSYKIILVRNPFARLVSAYYDKMYLRPKRDGFKSYFGRMSRSINRRYRHKRSLSVEKRKRDDGRATFEDFVNSIVYRPLFMDLHWEPYVKTCTPCESPFDYIAKMETLPEDIMYLKQKLNISDRHSRVFFPVAQARSTPDTVKKYFEQIPKARADRLYKVYKNDFEVFGYEKPTWLC